jgi:hypothetical protein
MKGLTLVNVEAGGDEAGSGLVVMVLVCAGVW